MLSGRIIEERKNYYVVDSHEGIFRSLLKGVARRKQKRLAVGDIVSIEIFDKENHEAVIRKIEPRKNELPRPVVANIDQVLFVNCLIEPALEFSYIDRFLFAASVNNIEVHMLYNKTDLLNKEGMEELELIAETYALAGIKSSFTSIEDDDAMEKVKELCDGKLTVFAGPSGVGKSSIMQELFPEHEFITNELSEHISRGRNTTTHTSLLKLAENSYIADTPGFSYMKIPKVEPVMVNAHFQDIADIALECRFNNCIHREEPGCAVKEALEEGTLDEVRYDNYLGLVEQMESAAVDYKKRNMRYI